MSALNLSLIHISELYFLAFALQSDVTFLYLVCPGVLVNAIDIDLSLIHISDSASERDSFRFRIRNQQGVCSQ